MCKVRLKPQHSVITNLSVLAQDMKIGYLPNYEKEKATIYISYLWEYDLQFQKVSSLKSTTFWVLNDPVFNKGLAFTWTERDRMNLIGILPPVIRTMNEQERIVMDELSHSWSERKDDMIQNDSLYLMNVRELYITPCHTKSLKCRRTGRTHENSGKGLYFVAFPYQL